MAWQKLDATAFTADKALSAAHGAALVNNVAAARTDRRRGAGWAADFRSPVILSGDGSSGDLDEGGWTGACALPLLWRPGRLDVSELALEVWGANPHATLDVRLGVKAVSLADFLRDGPGDEPSDWTTLAATATDRVELTCSLAGLTWQEGDHLVILLAVQSEVGPVEVLYDVKLGVDTTGVVFAQGGDANRLITDPDATWDGSAQANTRLPFRLLMGSADTGGAFDSAAFVPGGSWDLLGQILPTPGALHGLAVAGVGGASPDIYVYPFVPLTSAAPSTTDAIARQGMGRLELFGLDVYESDGGAFGLGAGATAIGAPTSGLVIGTVIQEQEDQFVSGDGPVAIGGDVSGLDDAVLAEPASRVFPTAVIGGGGGWSTVCEWPVGGPRSYVTAPGGSPALRNTYVVDAVMAWVDANNGADPAEALLGFRAVIADSGGDIEGEEVVVQATALHFAPTGNGLALQASTSRLWAHLFGWDLGGSGYLYRGRHSLRDQLPWGLMQRPTSLVRVRVEVQDGGVGSTSLTTPQILRLEARFAPQARYPSGSGIVGHDAIHLLTAIVDWPLSNNPADLV